ncbi:hypothetical protein MKW94_004233 [Papaver nudicaule]|uniref:Uncharacterized protein n=1 Tax=Papaver nudicaule TaxID=74823 RepID=A0AA41VQR5_PAPNU|nr:hypothetical protein [Papaver nudicaule]
MEHQLLSSCAMDSFFDDRLDKTTHASTHANTFNQPEQGVPQNPELAHSPNYIHLGTRTLPVQEKSTTEDTDESVEKRSKKRNLVIKSRRCVSIARERKPGKAALEDDELIKMRIVDQQMLKRLQGLIALEQQVASGRIKGHLGSFPYRNRTNGMGIIPQNMPQPSTTVEVVHQMQGVPRGRTNVRLNTNFNTSTAAKTRKGKSLNKCLNV